MEESADEGHEEMPGRASESESDDESATPRYYNVMSYMCMHMFERERSDASVPPRCG